MPFLVDSVTMEVNRHGLTLHLIIHPIIAVRARRGRHARPASRRDGAPDAHARVVHPRRGRPRRRSRARLDALAADLARVLGDVRLAVDRLEADAASRLLAIVAELDAQPAAAARRSELAEGKAFLRWLADDHFTFLGYRRHDLVAVDGQDALRIVPGSSLGILREKRRRRTSRRASPRCRREVRAYARRPELLVITKSNVALDRAPAGLPRLHRRQALRRRGQRVRRAPLPRPVHVDRLQREPGRDSAAAAQGRPTCIARAGLARGQPRRQGAASTSSRPIRATSCSRPREDELLRTAIGILHLGERQRFRLFVRRDPFERFVVVPDLRAARELHHRAAPEVAGDPACRRSTASSSEFNVHLSESVLARIHDHRAHDARQHSRPSTCASSRRGSSPRRGAGTTI